MTPGPNAGGGVAPGPPAGGVRNQRGNQAQGRGPMTKQALRRQRGSTPTGGVKPGAPGGPGRFGNGRKTPLERERERERRRRERQRQAQANANANNNTGNNKPKPQPGQPPVIKPKLVGANPYETKPDPRDENYYANLNAINATYDVEFASLNLEGQQAETNFNEEGMLQAEYNRQRKRNMGEARLGSGSAYSGRASRDQLENDLDYAISEGRRFRDKQEGDLEREIERGRLTAQRDADIRELETSTAEALADRMADESANSAGDALPENTDPDKPEPDAPAGRPGNDPNRRFRVAIRKQTARIKALRKQLAKTEDPKKRAQIEKRIRRLRKRRSQTKGKLR